MSNDLAGNSLWGPASTSGGAPGLVEGATQTLSVAAPTVAMNLDQSYRDVIISAELTSTGVGYAQFYVGTGGGAVVSPGTLQNWYDNNNVFFSRTDSYCGFVSSASGSFSIVIPNYSLSSGTKGVLSTCITDSVAGYYYSNKLLFSVTAPLTSFHLSIRDTVGPGVGNPLSVTGSIKVYYRR